VYLRSTETVMAKRNIRKSDTDDTTAPTRRRTTAGDPATVDTAAKSTRSRRKANPALATTPTATDVPETLEAAAIAEPPLTFGAGGNGNAHFDLPHEQIAVRAYHIYLERGRVPGDQFADWLTAERELREQLERADR
jgi:Protein of unknown function (DUF2934)